MNISRFFRFLCLLLGAFPLLVQADLFGKKPFLTGEQAFAFSSSQQGDQLKLHWQIADGYYLYQRQIQIKGEQVTLGEWQFPASERHHDDFFGEVEIFRQQLALTIPLQHPHAHSRVEVQYQGCTKGFCYPPETVVVALQAVENAENLAKTPPMATASPSPNAEQTQLASHLTENRLAIFGFFLLGVGLAFTPCVLPMLPLLSAIVIGNQQRPNNLRAALLSLTYVQGMALTYTLLGLIVAAIGLPFQVALQSPPVLIALAILFVLLAMSMFGVFTLQLPHRWQQKLNQLSQKQQGGAYPSVFVMGMIAGLVASPCTSAPLSGALLYVAQSGDLLTGGLALYLLALGMGLPLMLITLFGNHILPKSGDWLLKVKTLFGFVMLALPIFLLSRVLPPQAEPLMWSALAIALLYWLSEQFTARQWRSQAVRFLLIFAMLLAAKPWSDQLWQTAAPAEHASSPFVRIHSLAELEQQLAQHRGKKAMLDLYADWCVACKEFEQYTFRDPHVQTQFQSMLVLQIDLTQNSPENTALMKHFQILGLPTLLFFDETGKELTHQRVTGFLPATEFLAWLKGI